jgi:hypothetical protein
MHLHYKVWLKGVFAFVLFLGIFLVVLWADLFIWNAPSIYAGEGPYSREERIAIASLVKITIAAIAVITSIVISFGALSLLVPKPAVDTYSRYPRFARFFYYFSKFLSASVVGLLVSYGTLTKALAEQGLLPNFVPNLHTILMQFAGTATAITYALYRACRLSTASQAVSNDSRPPVVYLRSFQDEKRYRVQPSWRGGSWWRAFSLVAISLEAVIASAVDHVGPFIALAKPGQFIPVDGAARDSVDNEHWKAHVISFLERARAIIILPGKTGGLAWEISWLHTKGMFAKVAFVIPPGPRYWRRRLWRNFCSETQLNRVVELPSEDEVLDALILYVCNGRLISLKGKRTESGYIAAISKLIIELDQSSKLQADHPFYQ